MMTALSDSRLEGLPRTADAVVIGGGVISASTAFQLARRGAGKVVLLERRTLAAGATGKSGAIVRCHYANTIETELTLHSLRIFQNWKDEVGHGDCGFDSPGFLRVVGFGEENKLRANVEAHRAIGVNTRVVEPGDLRELEPLMRTDDVAAAAYEPESGYADPVLTTYSYCAAAVSHGAEIRTQTEATGILVKGGQVVGVTTSRGTIMTKNVVVAAGGWANRLLVPLGIDLDLSPRRVQVVIFRWPETVDHGRRHHVVIDSIAHSWFRPDGSATTLIGVENIHKLSDPDVMQDGADDAYINRARATLTARLPAFEHALTRGSWSGMVMESPDAHPIIDHVPGTEGLYIMTGDSGSSFKTAPAIGICLAEWILEGAPKLMDLTPFRSSRFAEGKPWVDELSYGSETARTISR